MTQRKSQSRPVLGRRFARPNLRLMASHFIGAASGTTTTPCTSSTGRRSLGRRNSMHVLRARVSLDDDCLKHLRRPTFYSTFVRHFSSCSLSHQRIKTH